MALTLSIISIVLSSLALGWNIQRWRLDAPRLKVTISHGVFDTGQNVVMVKVRNVGRAETQIQSFPMLTRVKKSGLLGRRTPTGDGLVMLHEIPGVSASLPHTLRAGHMATWYYEDVGKLAEYSRKPGWFPIVSSVNGIGIGEERRR